MDSKVSSDNFSEYFVDNQNVHKEEEFNCYLCSATYEKDLQLAAELGKTLLERNKELETSLKNHQNVIEDQSQEIEYLTKQTAALKEVNTSRIKIYEQLEISIQELEHSKETLSRQNAADKKQIKSLQETIVTLESKCDELHSTVDRLVTELENEKRQRILDSTEINSKANESDLTNHKSERSSMEFCSNCVSLSNQLQELKITNTKDQKMIVDLRDQISILLQENHYLQDQVDDQQQKVEDMKKLQEELATLEQIRLGNFCKRCLRSTIATEDNSSADELSLVMVNEKEDDVAKSIAAAIFNSGKSSPALEIHPDNPYRMLVEKYEALLRMQEQQQHVLRQRGNIEGSHASPSSTTKSLQCMSLRDELQLSDNFYNNEKKEMTDSEFEDEHDDEEVRKRMERNNKKIRTLSPGFRDDAVHKGTQTEVLAASLPGSFLCKISDGNDCQFSIYDDASPVESRFRNTPGYRQLFKEIFVVLKRAAEAKDEGESLPLLDDRLPAYTPMHEHQLKVPPATPACEEQPFVTAINDASEVSSSVDQAISGDLKKEHMAVGTQPQAQLVTSTTSTVAGDVEDKPAQRDIMEKLMTGIRPKRNLSRGDRRALAAAHRASPSPSPCNSRSSSKRRSGSKARRKRERLTDSPNRSRERHLQKSNNPVDEFNHLEVSSITKTTTTSERPISANGRKGRPVSMFAFGSEKSSASMEVAKLKYLEKSYAEVLRMGCKKPAFGKSNYV